MKHFPVILFIGLALGKTGTDELIIKKGKKNVRFKTNQKLVVNSSIEGMFKEIISDDLVISTKNSIDEKVPISSIKKISVPSKLPANISFLKGACFGAGIALIPAFIMAYEDPLYLMVVHIYPPLGAALGGLTSYIVPKFKKNKVYLIQENEWEIVND